MEQKLLEKLKKIKLLALDFDGVMTDGCVYVNQKGEEMVKCNRKDGLGIGLLKKNKIDVVVISTEENPVVSVRCKKLKIDCWQSIQDSDTKLSILQRLYQDKGLKPEQVAYVGDDLNDLDVFGSIGVSITVADGHNKLKAIADFVTEAKGGGHAVREVCELVLTAQGVNLEF